MENWKDIKGYEGLYEISDQGRVRSLIGKEKILKPRRNTMGYLRVHLFKDGIGKDYRIHRLVAMNFLDNPSNKPEVNHINGIKEDNRLCNLEWNTSKENTKHAVDTGLINQSGSNNASSKLTEKEVLEIRSSNLTQKKLGRIYGVGQSQISRIKRRELWTHV